MSIVIYAENEKGTIKKQAWELASYACALAEKTGDRVIAITVNAGEVTSLYPYGVEEVFQIQDEKLDTFNAQAYASAIGQAAVEAGARTVLVSTTANARYLAPLLAARLGAAYVPNVVELPSNTSPFTVKRMAFSNKGFAHTEVSGDLVVLGISSNSFGTVENPTEGSQRTVSVNLSDSDFKTRSIQVDKVTGKATIADADIVVSAGRGLKGPENWGMIEELAEVLGAATACSKPVSDMGWRPHGEHVGQTGKPVSTNLYFAIGISGAIQHLAGVSASKVKVVINTDPEAPFFKAADYGVVGDAFEVVPELTQKLRVFKENNS